MERGTVPQSARPPDIMKVLIPTNRSDLFGGAETFTRDLALGLARRGHTVAVFSDGFHKTARPMESESINVIRDIRRSPFVPDIIHGQFALETAVALAAMPGVPAVFHCHGGGYFGAPFRHPRIYRYVAITPSLAQRLVIELRLPESAMVVVPNGVDLHRFTRVRKRPAKPVRALFYNSYHREQSPTLIAIREAAEISGLRLDQIGRRLGSSIENPEEVLAGYDLVFASGKSAIEALSAGCAVIAIGLTGCGELVDLENFDRLRRANFSVAVNSPPASARGIAAEIARYAPDVCAAVTKRARQEANGDIAILRLEEIYTDAIERNRQQDADMLAEHDAMARYLRRVAPFVTAMEDTRAPSPLMPMSAERGARSTLDALNVVKRQSPE